MELRSLARISLPKDEYVYLLGMAIKESGQLKSPIAQTITKNAGAEIAELFSDIVYRRNRIIHSFRCTSSKNEQILATKDRRTHKQFDIEAEYLLEFIKLNNKLSDLLHKYRGY